MSCATVEPPTEAEVDAAPASTVEGYRPAEGIDHITAAVRAVRAADTPPLASRSRELNRLQLDRLGMMSRTVKSEALRRALDEARRLVGLAQEAGEAHTAAELALRVIPDDAADVDIAGAAEIAADKAQQEAWEVAWEALLFVGEAPFDGYGDLLIRADALTVLTGVDGEPAEEDARASLASLRNGVSDLDACRVEDPEGAVAGLMLSYRKAASDLRVAHCYDPNQAEASMAAALLEMHRAVEASARARASDLNELLFKAVGLGRLMGIDVSSYAVRDDLMTRSAGGVVFHQMVASIAADIAALRDAQLPADWREALTTIGGAHPNGRDAVISAYGKSMHLGDLTNIQVNGQSTDQLPILSFANGEDEFFTVGPQDGYVWRPVR